MAPPKFRPVQFRIRDFRAIDDLTLTFPEGTADEAGALVIAGENGCGKTSVLEAMLLVLRRFSLLPRDMAPPGELVRMGARTFDLQLLVSYAHGSGSLQGPSQLDRSMLEGILRRETRSTSASPKDSADDYSQPLLPRDQSWVGVHVEYVSARREPERIDVHGETSKVLSQRRLEAMQRRLVNAFARSRSSTVFKRLTAFIQPFFGAMWELDVVFEDDTEGADAVVVVRDAPLPTNAEGAALSLRSLRTMDAQRSPPRVIPLDRLSDGQKSILAMAYPFVFGDAPVDLALMDEPEQHLHPAWQRALLPALRQLSPQTYFVVTTHSAQVLDSVPSYERVLLTAGIVDERRDAAE